MGCSAGTVAVCDPRVGMACVPQAQIPNTNVNWYGWNGPGSNFADCGPSSYSGSYNNGCNYRQTVGMGCDPSNPHSCGNGLACRPLQQNWNGFPSSVGICSH